MNFVIPATRGAATSIIAVLCQLCLIPVCRADGPTKMVEVTVGKSTVEGRILALDDKTLVLLRRDGGINYVPRSQIADLQQSSNSFKPTSKDELRTKLVEEFGANYTVSRTAHFLVVHPPGNYHKWAAPFEELYLRFGHYFSSRGFQVPDPEFPLVAVVLNTREEFDRFLSRHQSADPQILGYYAPNSNRIITYRQETDPHTGLPANMQDLSTIVHEAAHQTAFNTGIHSRYSVTPRWASEGLAIMFESRGVNNSQYFGQLEQRVHRAQLDAMFMLANRGGQQVSIGDLIASDEAFRSDPNYAYALSWGLTFFLAETKQREYFAYLEKSAAAEKFGDYGSRERLEDFAASFGGNLDELEQRMWKYLGKLR